MGASIAAALRCSGFSLPRPCVAHHPNDGIDCLYVPMAKANLDEKRRRASLRCMMDRTTFSTSEEKRSSAMLKRNALAMRSA